jgi:hypothetical protein
MGSGVGKQKRVASSADDWKIGAASEQIHNVERYLSKAPPGGVGVDRIAVAVKVSGELVQQIIRGLISERKILLSYNRFCPHCDKEIKGSRFPNRCATCGEAFHASDVEIRVKYRLKKEWAQELLDEEKQASRERALAPEVVTF